MIIGTTDKEGVRKLIIKSKLSEELIAELKDDMLKIANKLKEDGIDTTMDPYYKLWENIGRCQGHLDSFK